MSEALCVFSPELSEGIGTHGATLEFFSSKLDHPASTLIGNWGSEMREMSPLPVRNDGYDRWTPTTFENKEMQRGLGILVGV